MKRFFSVIALCSVFCVLGSTRSLAESAYPQIDISGFKKWENKKIKIDPAKNYFAGLTQLGGFYPTFSGGPWQERLQLRILGQLSENLSVTYDLEQQPETPEKFDVKVKYYNNELTFGDLTANFSGNEFVSTSKYLNGVMLTAKDTWYDIVAVPSAKLKSQTQALTIQKGNNTKGPYNLGHGSIVEGSEQLQMNGLTLTRNVDYTLDYFEGKVTFNRILNSTDEFKYSYEYTNILDIFFPSLSKRDFFGFQSRFTVDPEKFGQPAPQEEPVITSARDVFPTAGSSEPEVQEEEASGRYRLRFAPLVKFSEVLTFMGTQLKKNEDYIIRYDTGELKLLTRFMPSSEEALAVEYRSYLTSLEVEVVPGIGGRGPYHTKNKRLVPESERIEVDSKPFVRNLDYTINYDTGEIKFGVNLGPTSQIKAVYRYSAMALPPETTSKFPKELKLGATYLKESAKKSGGTPTANVIESATGASLISNNFLLNLKNRPVLPTSEATLTILLKQGGISRYLSPEVDFTIPTTSIDSSTGYIKVTPAVSLGYITNRNDPTDGYGTGTIYFYNSVLNLQPTDEVAVTYTYHKSIVGKYSGVGDGSRGTYYLRNIRQIVPGSETLQVWDQGSSAITTYTRNTSFDALAGDTGYSINYNADNPSLTFNKELAPTKNFQLIFQYVAPQSSGSDNLSQVAYGFDGSFKIGNAFKLDSSYARSETDQVYVAETTVETFSGNATKNYTLHSPSTIIDASERLYINNQLLNRDIDYFISYTSPGTFNFYYVTPATQDVISVTYNYQASGGSISQTKVKGDSAFRLGAETRLWGDILTANGSTKRIGFDFSPLGGTAIGIGSEYNEYNLSFKPPFQSFFTNYSYKVNKNPLGTSRRNFTYSYDNALSTGINPGGRAQLNLDYRTLATIDDPLAPGALHNNDNQQESYSLSLAPADWSRGALGYSQKYDYRRTTSKADVIDQGANKSTQKINYYHASGNLKFTDRIGAGYDFQYNEPLTLGSNEAETAHTRILDNTYNLNLDLTMLFLQKWTARISLLNHDEQILAPAPASISTKNETYHMDINPFQILTGSLDHNRQERIAYTSGQQNPMSERTAAGTRLSPFGWFSVGGNYSRNLTIPETGAANQTSGRSKGGDIDFTPISFHALKLNSRFAASDTRQTAPSGAESVETKTNTLSQNYTLNINILPLLPVTCGVNVESYKNNNNSVTTPVNTATENQTFTANSSLTIPALPQLTLNGDYNRKVTKNTKTGDRRPKTVTNLRASYRVFTWGTLNCEVADEVNKGEVQAGSIVDLNLKKTTTTISLNITIPVDNPVLSNFNVLASLKQVSYINNQNHGDDFKAELISFEGTMNF